MAARFGFAARGRSPGSRLVFASTPELTLASQRLRSSLTLARRGVLRPGIAREEEVPFDFATQPAWTADALARAASRRDGFRALQSALHGTSREELDEQVLRNQPPKQRKSQPKRPGRASARATAVAADTEASAADFQATVAAAPEDEIADFRSQLASLADDDAERAQVSRNLASSGLAVDPALDRGLWEEEDPNFIRHKPDFQKLELGRTVKAWRQLDQFQRWQPPNWGGRLHHWWLYERRVAHAKDNMPRITTVKALVVAGNANGLGSYGIGRGPTLAQARRDALRLANKNMIYVPRYRDNALFHDVIGKCRSTKVVIKATPPGHGVVAAPKLQAIFECIGIDHVSAKIFSRRRNPFSVIPAVFDGLVRMVGLEERQKARGRKLVDMVPAMDGNTFHLPAGFHNEDLQQAKGFLHAAEERFAPDLELYRQELVHQKDIEMAADLKRKRAPKVDQSKLEVGFELRYLTRGKRTRPARRPAGDAAAAAEAAEAPAADAEQATAAEEEEEEAAGAASMAADDKPSTDSSSGRTARPRAALPRVAWVRVLKAPTGAGRNTQGVPLASMANANFLVASHFGSAPTDFESFSRARDSARNAPSRLQEKKEQVAATLPPGHFYVSKSCIGPVVNTRGVQTALQSLVEAAKGALVVECRSVHMDSVSTAGLVLAPETVSQLRDMGRFRVPLVNGEMITGRQMMMMEQADEVAVFFVPKQIGIKAGLPKPHTLVLVPRELVELAALENTSRTFTMSARMDYLFKAGGANTARSPLVVSS